MLIKTGNYSEFRNLLAVMRLAALQRRQYIGLPKKKFKYAFILRKLVEGGFISSYEERGEFLLIHFSSAFAIGFTHHTIAFTDIDPVTRLRRSGTVRIKDLDRWRRQKGPLELCFISSDQGIIESNVLHYRVGGLPLFTIK